MKALWIAWLSATIATPAIAEKIDLKMTGQQGDNYFFTVPKSHATNQEYLLNVSKGMCFNKTYCYIHIWEAGTAAPTRFPLTDREVKAQIASYTSNKRTGKEAMLWSCKKFPKTPKSACFS